MYVCVQCVCNVIEFNIIKRGYPRYTKDRQGGQGQGKWT